MRSPSPGELYPELENGSSLGWLWSKGQSHMTHDTETQYLFYPKSIQMAADSSRPFV